ncbi:hypothetical protein SIM91_05015 [Rhodococcus opacus]|uniref:hypothetical protein n=1 Tax=Rhodococcus opacus TaxID=37919 RepID=UPI0002A37C93|nr:hypothetical protein [Rhodococcus opacus]ELB88170.1 hypothetical protein Rwratislav_36084 [Rhodococcus wratislaviensis IFP 2016]MDX5962684.1 hypothetical protein [Rhodococcus opacus]CAG7636423.1 hypothetical protein E143388_07793 [Rhodococcus opacus]
MTRPSSPNSIGAILGRVTTIDVPCRDCGSPVSRPAQLSGRPDSWRDAVRCPAHAAAAGVDAASARAASVRDRDSQTWIDTVRAFDVVAGYEHASVDEIDSTKTSTICRRLIDTHTAADPNTGHRGGVALIGPTGIGKTRALFAVVNALAPGRRALVGSEDTVLAVDVPPWELAAAITARITGVEVLGIDDVGVSLRRPDERMLAWKALVDAVARAPHPVTVVLTTNLQGWTALTDWIGAQAASRLSGWTPLASPGWTDRRTGRTHDQWRQDLLAAQRPEERSR